MSFLQHVTLEIHGMLHRQIASLVSFMRVAGGNERH